MPVVAFRTSARRYAYSSRFNDAFALAPVSGGLGSGLAPGFPGVRPLGAAWRAVAGLARLARLGAEDFLVGVARRGPAPSGAPDAKARAEGQGHEQLILNLTEECNFRCRYCLYGGGYPGRRGHSRRNMPLELALAAVERFLARRSAECHISFYGGEPLLRMDAIRRVVAWADARLAPGEARPLYALTTNGSLLEGETARFLVENHFSVTVSLDGPAPVHDARRVDANGRPTHRRVLENVERLTAAAPDWARSRLLFSCVCLDEADIPAMHGFFSGHPILSGCGVGFAFAVPGGAAEARSAPEGPDVLADLEARYLERVASGQRDRFLEALFEAPYIAYHQRRLRARDPRRMLGCCVPGLRRLFVAADGALHPCEKLDGGTPLGHVSGWLEPARANALHETFVGLTRPCRSCWARELCTLCFASFFDGASLTARRRDAECAAYKEQLRSMLSGYHALYERDPAIPGRRFGGGKG